MPTLMYSHSSLVDDESTRAALVGAFQEIPGVRVASSWLEPGSPILAERKRNVMKRQRAMTCSATVMNGTIWVAVHGHGKAHLAFADEVWANMQPGVLVGDNPPTVVGVKRKYGGLFSSLEVGEFGAKYSPDDKSSNINQGSTMSGCGAERLGSTNETIEGLEGGRDEPQDALPRQDAETTLDRSRKERVSPSVETHSSSPASDDGELSGGDIQAAVKNGKYKLSPALAVAFICLVPIFILALSEIFTIFSYCSWVAPEWLSGLAAFCMLISVPAFYLDSTSQGLDWASRRTAPLIAVIVAAAAGAAGGLAIRAPLDSGEAGPMPIAFGAAIFLVLAAFVSIRPIERARRLHELAQTPDGGVTEADHAKGVKALRSWVIGWVVVLIAGTLSMIYVTVVDVIASVRTIGPDTSASFTFISAALTAALVASTVKLWAENPAEYFDAVKAANGEAINVPH